MSQRNTPLNVNCNHRSALTLLELVVVLAILSVLALAAVLATESTLDQARYESTVKTLENLQTAIAGPTNQRDANGEIIVSGFIADTGGLPRAVSTDSATALSELYIQPARLVGYQAFNAMSIGEPEVTLFTGWRGPYLRPPAQSDVLPRLLDGWGNSFVLNNGAIAVNDPIVAIQSKGGSSGAYIGAVPATPLVFSMPTATIVGSIEDADPATSATSYTRIRVFVADPTPPGGIKEVVPAIELPPGTSGFTVPNVPVGTVAIRAYQLRGATGGGEIDTAKPKSAVKYVRVPAGGPPPISLRFDLK